MFVRVSFVDENLKLCCYLKDNTLTSNIYAVLAHGLIIGNI
jgi:hypothetical protein